MDSIGADLNELSRFEEAATTLRHAITLFREVGDRRGEGVALNHLGTALRGLQRFEESITACQQSIELLPGSVDIGGPLDNLAMSLLAAGRETETAEVWERITLARSESDDPSIFDNILGNNPVWTNPRGQQIFGAL
ncbi:MAG: tetratricopeptide repeat protein [Pseudonocardiaceae bacterium]